MITSEGKARSARRLLAALGVTMAALTPAGTQLASASTGAAAATTCRHTSGPFHVSGSAVYDRAGRRFIPYGINLTGLRLAGGSYGASLAAAEAEEDAAAAAWCANLVRLGAVQEDLIAAGKVNRPYLGAIRAAVSHAEADGLLVAVTVGQRARAAGTPVLPVWRTLQAWRALAYHYGADPRVIFDLLNEPSGSWSLWRNGGRAGGKTYYGMQYLARYVRGRGARNLLWVQGIRRGSTLAGIPRWHLWHAGPLEYDEHRPPAPHTPASWHDSFGLLTGHWPVVEGEWADYTRADAPWACWNDAPVSVPRFLNYLAGHGIGLVGYDLAQPRLLESPSLTDPNRIRPDWRCKDGLDEGAGNQILHWLTRLNGS